MENGDDATERGVQMTLEHIAAPGGAGLSPLLARKQHGSTPVSPNNNGNNKNPAKSKQRFHQVGARPYACVLKGLTLPH